MRRIKTLILALVFMVGLFVSPAASALDIAKTSDYDYELTGYDVDIVVNENNTFDITEKIDAFFYSEKHGIFRTIPLYNKITRQDETSSKNRAKITNIEVSDPYTTSREDENLKIKIGDPDYVLTGKKSYTIKYNYNIGEDRLENADEFYFDIIGTKWDTTISNIAFTIHMPKEFDKDKIGFSTGSTGSTGSDYVYYKVKGNTISGEYLGTLDPYHGINVRITLPEGYFVGAGIEVEPIVYFLYVLPVIFALIAVILWYKYGKDDRTFVKPEYYPPEGFNSLEVGFLYKGTADSKDVISLLIYLANKGYLKIEEAEEKTLFSKKKSFKVTKVKDYDGGNAEEKRFMRGLFLSGKTVTASDLYDKFYKTTSKIISDVNAKANKEKIFEKRVGKIALVVAMIVASFCIITIPPFAEYGDYEELIFGLLFPGIGFSVLFAGIISAIKGGKDVWFVGIFLVIWGVMFGGIPFAMIVIPQIALDITYIYGYIFGVVAIIVMMLCAFYMPKRTPYGVEILAKIQGFKDFLTSVEKDRLEQMVEENPTYFYDVLPYTYVLGISDKWMKKFEDINLKAPDWYNGSDSFSMGYFHGFMTSTMSAATSNMSSSSSVSHSSGSGGGGGGSVGGGSGGGGGGSW